MLARPLFCHILFDGILPAPVSEAISSLPVYTVLAGPDNVAALFLSPSADIQYRALFIACCWCIAVTR